MSSRISLWVGLIGIAATIPLVQSIASAKTSVEIADTATAITVLITEPNSVGSGVILQRQGDTYTVLTAAHVVKNKVSYKITTPDNRSYEVISSSIRSAPDSIDLAVVKFKSITKYPTAKLGNCNVLKLGMDLYVAGFPATTKAIPESTFVFMSGKVAANSNKVAENGYSLIYNNITQPGMSGGAVLNSDGELVAIHGRGDRDEDSRKTGLNLGIPINRFAMVASNMGVDLGGQVAAIPQNTAPKVDDYIASAAQKSLNRDYRGALADYNRAIQLDPNNATTYVDRGGVKESYDYRIAEGKIDYWGALADYNRAIQLDPNFLKAYLQRGSLKSKSDFDNIRKRDHQGAIADVKQAARLAMQQEAIAFSRKDTDGQWTRGRNYIEASALLSIIYSQDGDKKGDLDKLREHIEYLSQLIATYPDWIGGYINRGELKYELQDYRGAISDYKQATSISKEKDKYPKDYYLLALAKSRSNDLSGAIADMKEAARLYQKEGNSRMYQRAIEYLKDIEFKIYYSQGDKKADAGNYREAIVDFSRAIALNSRYTQAYVGRGRSKYELKDYSGAISDYKQALSIDPRYASAYFNLGLVKAKQNDLKGAISDMQQAVQLYQQEGEQKNAQDAMAQIKQWQQTSQSSWLSELSDLLRW
jgi:tetratricopeptide (TPR) repeat protein